MQIHVGLPSRGRPLDMVASAVSLFRLASGSHDVQVTIAYDRDDPSDDDMMHEIQREFERSFPGWDEIEVPRPLGLGEIHNELASRAPPDAVFMLWSDRVQVITPDWDQIVAVAAMHFPKRVLWLDSVHLQGPGQFILPPAWRAAQGAPCPGLAPFWFDDSHVEEIDAFVHGWPRIAVAAKCAGVRKLPTNRCRDIPFWVDLYAATRPQRIEQSRAIADKLGVTWQPRPQELAYFEARDVQFRERSEQLLAEYGEPGPPDETYIAAKARAETLLAELRA